MQFELLPIIDQMLELYKIPTSKERFDRYLFMLQGNNKSDMILPIASYNPMAKELAIGKLKRLNELGAEDIVVEIIDHYNSVLSDKDNPTIKVAINLIDDVEGSWSNHFTTDYKIKFELENLIKRRFCTPCFWSGEEFDKDLISRRIHQSILRTVYCITNGHPQSLEECFLQEVYISRKSKHNLEKTSALEWSSIEEYFEKYKSTRDYNRIFNFFYGDEASQSLSYPSYGMRAFTGFHFANYLAIN